MAEYINRQALLRFLNDIWLTATPNDFMPDDDRHLAMVRCMGLNDAMDAVKSIPTADVVPVVRGKWEIYFISMLDGEGCKCSECGFEGVPYWDYCPNCGADMREES